MQTGENETATEPAAAPQLFAVPAARPRHETFLQPRTVAVGAGSAAEVGAIAATLGTRPFLVTYRPGRTTEAGGPAAVAEALRAAGLTPTSGEVPPDPDTDDVDRLAHAAAAAGADVLVAVGGGAALDAAKVAAMLITNGGGCDDFHTGRTPSVAPLPLVAVPTTIGTGSEVTRVGVVRNRPRGFVKSVGHPSMIPAAAVIDPELVASLPTPLAISGSLDALGHAIESYLSLGASLATDAAALQAVALVVEHLPVMARGGPGRHELMLASYLAGWALNAGPGLAHVIAQPLTAVTGLRHADLIAALLPLVAEVNEPHAPDRCARLASAIAPGAPSLTDALHTLYANIGAVPSLAELGLRAQDVDDIVAVTGRSMGHLWTNPAPVSLELVRSLLETATAADGAPLEQPAA